MTLNQSKNGKRVVFSESSYHKVAKILADFKRMSNANLCVFADMNGYPITYSGELRDLDISTLSALAAGDFAATTEMSKMISGENQFKFIYHEGLSRNIYLCNVGNDYLLIVVFGKNVALGMIRVLANQVINNLHSLLAKLKEESAKASQFLDAEFRDLLNNEIDKSLGLK